LRASVLPLKHSEKIGWRENAGPLCDHKTWIVTVQSWPDSLFDRGEVKLRGDRSI